jgi:hypothetical protein
MSRSYREIKKKITAELQPLLAKIHKGADGCDPITVQTRVQSAAPKKYLVSHSRINPAPWKYLIYTNPAQGFLPDRLQNTPKIPVFQSRTPKINRYFSCAQSPRRAKNDIFAR